MRNIISAIGLFVLIFSILMPGIVGEMTIPGFDNSVSASSSVSNMHQVALSSKLRSSLTGADESIPGEVHYSVSISGINGSAYGGAVGTAKTEFIVSTLEGRDTLLNESSERVWRDSTEISGTIVNFRKNFDYASGIQV